MTEMNQKRFTGEGPTASEDYRRFKKWVQSHIFYKKVDSEAQGPFLYSYAAKDGIDILWFPQKAPIDSMGEALGEVFHLQASPGETMAAWTGRATQVFVTCRSKARVEFPSEAQGWLLMHRCGLDDNQKAVVKAQTAGSHRAEDVGPALRSCFPSFTVRGKREHVYAVDDEEDFDTAKSTVEAFEDVEAFLAEGDISEIEATTFEEEEVRDVLAVSWKDFAERSRQQRPLGTSHEYGSYSCHSERRWTTSRSAQNATSVVALAIGPVIAEFGIEEEKEEKVRRREHRRPRARGRPQVPSLASP